MLWKALLALYTFRSRLSPDGALQRVMASQPYTRSDLCPTADAAPQRVAATAGEQTAMPVWLQDLCEVSERRVAPLALRRDALLEHEALQQHLRPVVGPLSLRSAPSHGPPPCSLPWKTLPNTAHAASSEPAAACEEPGVGADLASRSPELLRAGPHTRSLSVALLWMIWYTSS